jgi:transcription initiation factor TFIIF subunit alpha
MFDSVRDFFRVFKLLLLNHFQTDSEEERQRVDEEKKANREKAEADKKSGISSNGTNTPSGRKEKHGAIDSDRDAAMKKSGSMKSLKRPGSPNLSDASGTDASVRKKKKHRHPSSSQNTPQPSRPISPANVPSSSAPASSLDPSKPMKKRKSMAPGSRAGSDTEAATYSDGGAMLEGSKNSKRIKLNVSASGLKSPPTVTPQGGSRATSPKPSATSAPAASLNPSLPFPTAQEIFNAIPATGISSSDLLRQFKNRTVDRRAEFFEIVKSVARLDKATKVLMPKAQAPAAS